MHILHKRLNTEEQEQFYPLTPLPVIDVEVITYVIQKFDSINVCYGSALVSKYPSIKISFGSQYEIHHGYWKHINCLKILINNRYCVE